VRFGLEMRFEVEGGEGVGGFRADGSEFDGREFFEKAGQIKAAVEMLNGRGTGEGEPISSCFKELGYRSAAVFGFGNSAIAGDIVNDGAQGFQCFGEFPTGDFGPEEANFQVLDA